MAELRTASSNFSRAVLAIGEQHRPFNMSPNAMSSEVNEQVSASEPASSSKSACDCLWSAEVTFGQPP
jgi:hypothetical protein